FPTKPIHLGFNCSAMRSSRSADPSKSARRRSPEPGVVRHAAWVRPIPSFRTSYWSSGEYSRDVNLAACRSRQKSLRVFAKCAPAAAETRPGLMPQKTTRRPGARTSGTAELGCFGLGERFGVTRVERFLEAAPERLAF